MFVCLLCKQELWEEEADPSEDELEKVLARIFRAEVWSRASLPWFTSAVKGP